MFIRRGTQKIKSPKSCRKSLIRIFLLEERRHNFCLVAVPRHCRPFFGAWVHQTNFKPKKSRKCLREFSSLETSKKVIKKFFFSSLDNNFPNAYFGCCACSPFPIHLVKFNFDELKFLRFSFFGGDKKSFFSQRNAITINSDRR